LRDRDYSALTKVRVSDLVRKYQTLDNLEKELWELLDMGYDDGFAYRGSLELKMDFVKSVL